MSSATRPPPLIGDGLRELLGGTAGGMAQVLVGHPFNTVKVRLQTQPDPPKYRGTLHCFRTIVAEEGVLGLYKGMGSPFVGIGLVNAVVFYANSVATGTARRLLGYDPSAPLPLPWVITCGSLAGIANSIASCPIELVMVKLQTQDILVGAAGPAGTANVARLYRGPIDCAAQLLRQNGLPGLFKGMTATVLREIPGYGAYFGGYEATKRWLASRLDSSHDSASSSAPAQLPPAALLFAGGIAGICAQVSQLPLDVVKSRLQTQPEGKPLYKGWWDCTSQLWRERGLRGFYKGIGPVLLRAFPANAATFAAYEFVQHRIKQLQQSD